MLPTIGRAILGGKNAIVTVSRKNSYKVLKSEKKYLLWNTQNKDNYRRKTTDLRSIISLTQLNIIKK